MGRENHHAGLHMIPRVYSKSEFRGNDIYDADTYDRYAYILATSHIKKQPYVKMSYSRINRGIDRYKGRPYQKAGYGDHVQHKKYGTGVVTVIDCKSIKIHFDDNSDRTFAYPFCFQSGIMSYTEK